MSVTLNEGALAELLDTATGPVGRMIARKAEAIAHQTARNIDDYFGSAPQLDVGTAAGFEMEGSAAIVGVRDEGPKSVRWARANGAGQIREGIREAIEAGRHIP